MLKPFFKVHECGTICDIPPGFLVHKDLMPALAVPAADSFTFSPWGCCLNCWDPSFPRSCPFAEHFTSAVDQYGSIKSWVACNRRQLWKAMIIPELPVGLLQVITGPESQPDFCCCCLGTWARGVGGGVIKRSIPSAKALGQQHGYY